jgi:hypothetical protein
MSGWKRLIGTNNEKKGRIGNSPSGLFFSAADENAPKPIPEMMRA